MAAMGQSAYVWSMSFAQCTNCWLAPRRGSAGQWPHRSNAR